MRAAPAYCERMAKARSKSNGGGGERAPEQQAPLVAIVDDDASVRQSTDRLIRSFGYRTQAFGSGLEFLSSVAAQYVACLVLDVRMAGMDGLDVQRTLAERGARIPIVFVTGQASDEEERCARSAGAVEFLRKPVRQANLRQAIESAVRAFARGERNDNRDS
jgi:FixJ family two-component response regulator